MAVRNGAQYREGLNDGRILWVGDKELPLTQIPHMQASIDGMAGYCDWQTDHADDCTAIAPETGNVMTNVMNISKRHDTAAMLVEILTFSRLTRAATKAAEANARDFGNGAFFPDEKPTNALRSSMAEWMVRTQEILIQIGSHNLLAIPSMQAIENPDMPPLLNKHLPGANGVTAQKRTRIFRTAWDFVGSALTWCNTLYECLSGQPPACFVRRPWAGNDGQFLDHLDRFVAQKARRCAQDTYPLAVA